MKLIKNRIQCKVCKKVIESKSRYDWVKCDCEEGYIYTDGGTEYINRGGEIENIIELDDYILESKDLT